MCIYMRERDREKKRNKLSFFLIPTDYRLRRGIKKVPDYFFPLKLMLHKPNPLGGR